MPSYNWLTYLAARNELANRLYDPNKVFTPDAEMGAYITQALRMFNVLTCTWKQDLIFTAETLWNSINTFVGSPRQRTLTDVDAYTMMEYMMLEPPTGATWTGTKQFDIPNLSAALQFRRDEMIKISNCNQSLMINIPLTPNTRRTVLTNDSIIDVARVRYVPVPEFWQTGYGEGPYGQGVYGYGGYGPYPPRWGYGSGGYGGGGGYGSTLYPLGITLYRDDTVAQEWYEPGFWQADSLVPNTYMLSSEPPLSWDVDIPPTYPGTYEAIVSMAGRDFNPPVPTLLNIPDDYVWVAQWGALSDLMGRESEATDRLRADYCLKRYIDGVMLLLRMPWVMLGKINGRAVTLDSIASTDRYVPSWDNAPYSFGPFLVIGGMDFLAAPVNTSIGLTVLANAPVPVNDDDFVQVSRDNWDTVLDLAQVFATFKMGGAEFQSALEIESHAIQACAAENSRLRGTGAFSDVLAQRGQAQDRDQERFPSTRIPSMASQGAQTAGTARGMDQLGSLTGKNQ